MRTFLLIAGTALCSGVFGAALMAYYFGRGITRNF